jgi:hypothetical protein
LVVELTKRKSKALRLRALKPTSGEALNIMSTETQTRIVTFDDLKYRSHADDIPGHVTDYLARRNDPDAYRLLRGTQINGGAYTRPRFRSTKAFWDNAPDY